MKALFSLGLAALLGCFTVSPVVAGGVPGEEHCVIGVASPDRLNVRERPRVGSRIIGTKRYGDCGLVVEGACRRGWCPVEDGHISGWVNSRFLALVSPALYCVTDVAPGDQLNLRAFPSASSRVLTRLGPHQCDIAFLPYATGAWQKIRVAGYEGWVRRKYLSGE